MTDNLLRRISKNNLRLNLSAEAATKFVAEPLPLSTTTTASETTMRTPPGSPKPLFVANGGGAVDKSMTREDKIAMLLEKAKPKKKSAESGDSKSERLERASSYSSKSDGSDGSAGDEYLQATKLERSASYDAKSPRPASTTPQVPSPEPSNKGTLTKRLSLSASAATSVAQAAVAMVAAQTSPRGSPKNSPRGKESRNSYSGSSNGRIIGTFTRIIYHRSVVLLGPPSIILIPNEVLTDLMREALQRAHSAEFGFGVDKDGFNEAELKAPAIWLCEKESSHRTKVLLSQSEQLAGAKGALVPYYQLTTPDPCIASTTITHEYIFKNSI